MGLPGVSVGELNGQLGRVVPTKDSVVGLVLSGVLATGLAISTPKQVFALADVEALGITAAYDTTNTTDVYKQIKEFYDVAGTGAELWFMIIPKTTSMTTACDKTNDVVKKLLNAAAGKIRLWGIARTPDSGYTATTVSGFDDDANTAIVNAQALCVDFRTQHKPCRAIIGARDFQGDASALVNLRAKSSNRVALTLFSTSATYNSAAYKNASVGYILGLFARVQVQRNIGRVRAGALLLNDVYFTNGAKIETLETSWGSIHDKGYIFGRTFANESGYYINDDPACCPLSDDYNGIALGRVADKAQTIAYSTYVQEVQEDIETDENGYISPAVLKDFQEKVTKNIKTQMIDTPAVQEISGVRCIVNPSQQISLTDTVAIEKLAIRPKGYAKYINVEVGFEVSSI